MKLYTEDQILEFIKFYESANPREYGGYQHPTMDGSELAHNNQTTKNILNAYTESITPIELPTHQEIEKEAFQVPYNGSNEFYDKSFIRGAKWVIDKIKKTEIRNFRITTKHK